MFCKNCGKEIKENEKFCPHCGQAVQEKHETQKKGDVNDKNIKKRNDIDGNEILKGQKRKSKKWIFIIPVLIIIIGVIAVLLIVNGDSDKKETIQKLLQDTDLYKTDNSYVFNYQGEWEIIYTEENAFVKIPEKQVSDCVEEAFEIVDAGNDDTFGYDFDTGNLNMYFDAIIPDGNLSIITYNLESDEFTLNIDGERYEPTDEFAEYLDSYKLADTLKEDISAFEDTLNQMELSVEQISNLSFSDLDKNIDSKDIGPEKQLILEEAAESEGQKESKDAQGVEKEDKTFIGNMGSYSYTDSAGNIMGTITISQVGNTCDFILSIPGMSYDIAAGNGPILDNKTLQIPLTGYSIICTWTDSDHMTVTRTGDPYGMDAGLIIDLTDDIDYVYSEGKEGSFENSSETGEETFIGISGSYVCTNSDLDVTGRISIHQTGNSCDFVLDTLETGNNLISESGKIVSSNTIQIEADGMIITCTWSDSKNMYVTCSAINQGMDAATLDNTINGRNYVYAAEFN